MKHKLITLFLLVSNITVYSQAKFAKLKNADFKYAIEIKDSIIGPVNVSGGYGSELDFKFDKDIKEENSAWFKFSIDHDTTLIFDIVPIDSTDDYDFILFKCDNTSCINDIKTKKIIPDRICYSQNFSKNGTTGLSEYETNNYVGIGLGGAYLSAIHIKANEKYYLMINYSELYRKLNPNVVPKGFRIYFYNYWPKKKPVILNNVLFESNKAILLKESFISLDKLVNQLKVHKTMKIEIRGHTDNVGDEVKNQLLSENRAKSVMDYIISKNIDAKRVFYKGFGSKIPVASNDTEEGRKRNRRVEFAIVIH